MSSVIKATEKVLSRQDLDDRAQPNIAQASSFCNVPTATIRVDGRELTLQLYLRTGHNTCLFGGLCHTGMFRPFTAQFSKDVIICD